METKDIIKKYEDELAKKQQYLKLAQHHNSYMTCAKTQIEIDMIKQFLQTLKQK